jgi:hypothetical protein
VIGHTTGLSLTTGGTNTIIGAKAGNKLTTGATNTILGANVASTTLTTGFSNIVIGVNSKADTPAAASQDTLTIQGNGAMAAISGTNLSGTPTITVPGIFGAGQFAAGHFSANGTVATALTSLGPAGANAAVQEWFTVKNAAGVTRYIPAF